MTENVIIALSCLSAIFVLIYIGMHIAVALGLASLVGVYFMRGDFQVAANLLAPANLLAVEAALACGKPAVVDVQIDPNALYSFRRDSFAPRAGAKTS